ncbi:MAG: hypothetical protein Q7S87_01210 [Agitococcus sp.]|nr:hypothetical protein [Agitococcus sp.]MDO9179144.1 hypothetical protein [Agitococcus sp.]
MSLAPLLMEHEAVTYFLSQPSNAGFLGFVANPTTPEEAVGIANVTEGPLTEQQREDLMELFYERRGWARGEPPN